MLEKLADILEDLEKILGGEKKEALRILKTVVSIPKEVFEKVEKGKNLEEHTIKAIRVLWKKEVDEETIISFLKQLGDQTLESRGIIEMLSNITEQSISDLKKKFDSDFYTRSKSLATLYHTYLIESLPFTIFNPKGVKGTKDIVIQDIRNIGTYVNILNMDKEKLENLIDSQGVIREPYMVLGEERSVIECESIDEAYWRTFRDYDREVIYISFKNYTEKEIELINIALNQNLNEDMFEVVNYPKVFTLIPIKKKIAPMDISVKYNYSKVISYFEWWDRDKNKTISEVEAERYFEYLFDVLDARPIIEYIKDQVKSKFIFTKGYSNNSQDKKFDSECFNIYLGWLIKEDREGRYVLDRNKTFRKDNIYI